MPTEQQGPESSAVLYPASFTKEDWKILAERTKAELLKNTNMLTENWLHDGSMYIDPDKQVPIYAAGGNKTGLLTFNHEWVDSFRENWQRETQKQIFIRMREKRMTPDAGQSEPSCRWNRLTMQEGNWWPFDRQGNVDLKPVVAEPAKSGDLEVMRGLYAACYDESSNATEVGQTFDRLVKPAGKGPEANYLGEVKGIGLDGLMIMTPVKGAGMVAKTPVGKTVIRSVATVAMRHKKVTVAAVGGTIAWLAYKNGCFKRRPLTQEERGQIIEYQSRLLGQDTETPLIMEDVTREAVIKQNQKLTEVLSDPDKKQQMIQDLEDELKLSGNVEGSAVYAGFKDLIQAIKNDNVTYDEKEGMLIVKEGGRINLGFKQYLRTHNAFREKIKDFYDEYKKEHAQQNITKTMGNVGEVATPTTRKTMGKVGQKVAPGPQQISNEHGNRK